MCLHIVFETMYSLRLWGFLRRRERPGGSVAKAREANVSMMRLTHNIWMGVRIDCLRAAAPITVQNTATTFTVNWNYRNFLIES